MRRVHPSSSSLHRSQRQRRGQAMVEYSMMMWLIAIAFVIGFTYGPHGSIRSVDDNARPSSTGHTEANSTGKDSILGLMIEAYQHYNDSYYFALCAPLP